MEMFIKIHGENRVFVGNRPKDAAQSLNRLELATGISSATRFASDSRHKDGAFHRPDGNRTTTRLLGPTLGPTTKVANLFRYRYMTGKNTKDLAGANVEKFLNDLSNAKTTPSETDNGIQDGEPVLSSTGPQQLLERKWPRTHSIGPLQLLALVKTKL